MKTINDVISFFEWKELQTTSIRGNEIMYDIKGYYKYLTENEIFDYYITHKL